MNDLPLHVVYIRHVSWLNICVTGETIEELDTKLYADLINVQQWCLSNKIAVNANKTKVMLVTSYQKEDKLSSSIMNFNFNDNLL